MGTAQSKEDGGVTGKSTLSRALAAHFGFLHLDTGALYRAIGVFFIKNEIDYRQEPLVCSALERIDICLSKQEGGFAVLLGGADVSGEIRSPEASMAASAVSAFPCVRAFLLDLQRDIAAAHSVVVDGRDIGTVVLPQADLKIFLTASLETRAKRRERELLEKGETVDFAAVLRDMEARDHNDASRAAAPLCAAEDARLLDTTELTFEGSLACMIELVEKRACDVL